MKDRDFLIWLHARLEHIHGEVPILDYMHQLRAIIANTPAEQKSANTGAGKNSLEELWQHLGLNPRHKASIESFLVVGRIIRRKRR